MKKLIGALFLPWLPLLMRLSNFYVKRALEKPGLVGSIGGFEWVVRLLLVAGEENNPRIFKEYGARIGDRARLHSPLLIHNAKCSFSNLSIGDNCHIGKDVFLDLSEPIEIGNNVTISMRTTIITHRDVGDSPLKHRQLGTEQGKVTIQKGAYIGAGAIILHGITIGECAVVGAGAVVTRNVPDGAIVVGIPARQLGSDMGAGPTVSNYDEIKRH